jgi:hypothetical protein
MKLFSLYLTFVFVILQLISCIQSTAVNQGGGGSEVKLSGVSFLIIVYLHQTHK